MTVGGSPVSYTDSHCHLTAEPFAHDLEDTLDRARSAGVSRFVTIASSVDDARTAVELASSHPGVWATAGVHPHAVGECDRQRDLPRLRGLAEEGSVVALGETGLDFHYDFAAPAAQIEWFRAHVDLAEALGLPLVVHSRNADAETLTIVEEAGARGVRGVLHCFTGGPPLLEAALRAGWYFGYGGIATFKNFQGQELLREVPVDRLLLETDAPYLAPIPMRGKRNEPSFLPFSAERVAECRSVSVEELARTTARNAAQLFGLPRLETQ